MPDALLALRASVDRLSALVRPLGDEMTHRAYPSAWTIADVLSHVGSSGVILQRRLDDALAGRETPEGLAEGVWAEWDAKAPAAKVADGLAADEAFTSHLESVGPDDRSRVAVSLGPMAPDGVVVVIDNLELIGRYTSVPVAPERTVSVATAGPDHWFAITIGVQNVDFSPTDAVAEPTLTMPAEAFIRVVYGRLDPDHTPASVQGDPDALEQLRQVFPGP